MPKPTNARAYSVKREYGSSAPQDSRVLKQINVEFEARDHIDDNFIAYAQEILNGFKLLASKDKAND